MSTIDIITDKNYTFVDFLKSMIQNLEEEKKFAKINNEKYLDKGDMELSRYYQGVSDGCEKGLDILNMIDFTYSSYLRQLIKNHK